MLLRIQELRRRKIPFDTTFRLGSVDLTGTKYQMDTPLRVAGLAQLIEGTEEIRVSARITGALAGECDRCLDWVRFDYDREFELFYRPAPKSEVASEIEIDDGETEIGFYDGDGLQLDHVVGEQLLLWLPMQCICSEQCKGICPVCGANRNKVSCDCHQKPVDERWTALRGFRASARPEEPGTEPRP